MFESAAATHSVGAVIVAPDRVRLLHPVDRRKRQLVARIGGKAHAAVRQRFGPMRARETAPCRAAGADCSSAGDRRRRRGSRTARSPADRAARRATSRSSPARASGVLGGNAEAVERDRRGARAPGARRRSACTTLPPRLWPARSTRLARRERVRAARRDRRRSRRTSSPAAATRCAEAAQIRRDHVPLARERVDQKLERRRRRPSSRAAERASAPPGRPTSARGESRPRSATSCDGTASSRDATAPAEPRGATRVTSCGTARGRPASRCDSCRRRRSARHPCARCRVALAQPSA